MDTLIKRRLRDSCVMSTIDIYTGKKVAKTMYTQIWQASREETRC